SSSRVWAVAGRAISGSVTAASARRERRENLRLVIISSFVMGSSGLKDIGVFFDIFARLFLNLHTNFGVELNIQVYGNRLLRRRDLHRRGAGGGDQRQQRRAENRVMTAKT